jgi:uncharacterized protein
MQGVRSKADATRLPPLWQLRPPWAYNNRDGNVVGQVGNLPWKQVDNLLHAGTVRQVPASALSLVASIKDTPMPVSMELSRIIISEVNDQQVIYLKEIDGERTFPILIGIFEATSIDRRVKGFPSPRPLTHDLIVNVVENLGGEFQDVIISELKDHTYYARLRVRHDGELVEIDARPSDAIAVAVTCNPPLPIYVNEDVLNDVLGEQQQ